MLTQEDIRKNLEKQKVIKDRVDIARSRVAKAVSYTHLTLPTTWPV